MNLFTVTFNHPRGGQRSVTIANESDDLDVVAAMCREAGLEVTEVKPHAVAPEPTPEPTPEPAPAPEPTGRLYGKSAEGPRRNRDEMEQDRRIEELAKAAEFTIEGEHVADDLEAYLSGEKAAE